MSHHKCCVPACKSEKPRTFRFPSDIDRQQVWVKRISPELADRKNITNCFVCEIHFHPICIGPRKLNKLALPTLHLPYYQQRSENDHLYNICDTYGGYTMPENLNNLIATIQEQKTILRETSPLRLIRNCPPMKTYSKNDNASELFGDECKPLSTKLRNSHTNAMKYKPRLKLRNKKVDSLGHIQKQKALHADRPPDGQEIRKEESSLSVQPPTSLEENVSSSNLSLTISATSIQSQYSVSTTTVKNEIIETSMDGIDTEREMKENACLWSETFLNNEMDMYFLNLSRTTQKLSPEEQVRVKMEVSRVVFQAELKALQRLSEEKRKPPYYTECEISCSSVPNVNLNM